MNIRTRNTIVALAVLASAVSDVRAEFAGRFQAAREQFNRKEYKEAFEAFGGLTAAAPNARGRAESVSMAARTLGYLGQYEQALEMAQSIAEIALEAPAGHLARPLAVYTQMEIMAANRKVAEIAAAFADEDIGTWPDRINYLGYYHRGVGHTAAGNRDAAIADLERCAELAGSDRWIELEAFNRVGALYRAISDDENALASYRKALAVFDAQPERKGRWLYPQAILGVAEILRDRGEYDQALVTLGACGDPDAEARTGDWWFLIIELLGDIHAARGDRERALARYRAAAAIETHGAWLKRVCKKIDTLVASPDED